MHTELAINSSDVPRPTGLSSPTPTGAYPDSVPVLWQLQVSHYVEKVRWALDYKRIPHIRHSLLRAPRRKDQAPERRHLDSPSAHARRALDRRLHTDHLRDR